MVDAAAIDPFLQLAINAVFTGIGTATGLWIFESFLKPRVETFKKNGHKIKTVVKTITRNLP